MHCKKKKRKVFTHYAMNYYCIEIVLYLCCIYKVLKKKHCTNDAHQNMVYFDTLYAS